MAKIAIDCDGVLANFIKAFAEEANHVWPGRFSNPGEYAASGHKAWNFDPAVLSHDDVKVVWKRIIATPNWWLTLDAFTDSVGALAVWLWTHRGHDLWIVTARTPTIGAGVAWQTNQWLRACGVDAVHNYLGVFLAEGDDKGDVYKYSGIEYSLDDRGDTVEACDALLPDRHHKAFLLDRPWNQDAKVRRRVKSVREYLEAIEK